MTVVTAVNNEYLKHLHPLLTSFFSFKENHALSLKVFIVELKDLETLKELKTQYPLVEWQAVDLGVVGSPQLIQDYHSGLKPLYFDCLRAWISRNTSPFLWLDTDIIIRSSLLNLIEVVKTSKIAMARDFTWERAEPTDFHWRMQSIYQQYFLENGAQPIKEVSHKLNNGVLWTSQDYFQRWLNWYELLRPKLDHYAAYLKAPEPYGSGAINTLGQGIWNFLFWEDQGLLIDSSWNRLVFQDSKPGQIHHFAAAKEAWQKITQDFTYA